MDPLDRLARIDLNLLVALYVLLDERNVTRAADRLFITQPAASRTLNRLRELLDDPLLTRAGSAMVMTPRAENLRARLPALLDSVGELVAPLVFEPAQHRQVFRLAIPELLGQALAGPLLQQLQGEAPGIEIVFQNLDLDTQADLASGRLDFAFYRADTWTPLPGMESVPVATVAGEVIAREGHPLARKRRLTLSTLLDYPWVESTPSETTQIATPLDDTLRELGLERRVSLRTQHLLSALQAVNTTDCLMLMAGHVRKNPLLAQGFCALQLPGELSELNVHVALLQNRRTQHSAAHHWLRDKLLQLAPSCWIA